MEWEKLHLIKNEKCFFSIFIILHMLLIEVNEFTYKVLERVKVGDAIENIITSFEIDKNDFHDLLCTLESLFNIIPNKNELNPIQENLIELRYTFLTIAIYTVDTATQMEEIIICPVIL